MWSAQPLFISSTFLDFQDERDFLRAHVFPALEERLRATRRHLEWVDLRIGVTGADETSVEAREQQVLSVCLAEVRRCRPFLLVLLGDRYGWIPPAERIAAVAAEEGLLADVKGRSATEIEIEFGALSKSDALPRALFYFREPLPYEEMGDLARRYRDGEEGRIKLATLKRRIDSAFPKRVRRYRAEWDAGARHVVSLEKWGQGVLEDLWLELSRDAPLQSVRMSSSQAAREVLQDFVEGATRDFVGRTALLERLIAFARSPAGGWAVCIVGAPGSGKSAVFGEVIRRLHGDELVLAHSPTAGQAAGSVDLMLRRWIEELAEASGERAPVLEESAPPEVIDQTFASHLRRAAAKRRVVLIVDALNQFEDTPRGRHATWLPVDWPANARLIVTSQEVEDSRSFVHRHGAERIELDTLSEGEAREIARAITARYHRTLEPRVLDALMAKVSGAGRASGNALWLSLAVEELNLVDGADLERAKQFLGRGVDQLLRLMLEKVSGMPPRLEELYAVSFEQAEKIYRQAPTMCFLALLALGRAGWRESDFRSLMPVLSGAAWDDLMFASLRRSFRGQLRRSGRENQWQLGHEQMRAAILLRMRASDAVLESIHRLIAIHLRALQADDLLHQTETMVHLMAAHEWTDAAGYFGAMSLSAKEVEGAVLALVEAMVGAPGVGAATLAEHLLSADTDDATRRVVTERVRSYVIPRVRGGVSNVVLGGVVEALRRAYDRLAQAMPHDPGPLAGLAFCFVELGRVSLDQGDTDVAVTSFSKALAHAQRAAALDPTDVDVLLGLAKCYANVGAGERALGKRTESELARRAALEVLRRLGPGNLEAARLTGLTLSFLSELARESGDAVSARDQARKALEILEAAARQDPDGEIYRRDIATTNVRLGLALEDAGDLTDAKRAHTNALVMTQALSARDPGDPHAQEDLAIALNAVGRCQAASGDLQAAEVSFKKAIDISQRLAARDTANIDWVENHAIAQAALSDVLRLRGHRVEAMAAASAAVDTFERVSTSDSGNLPRLLQWCRSLDRVGDMRMEIGDPEGALTNFRRQAELAEEALRTRREDVGLLERLANARLAAGECSAKLGRTRDAKAFAQGGHDIAQKLAQQQPANAEWRRLLALANDKLGTVIRGGGDGPGAAPFFEAAAKLTESRAQQDAQNADNVIDSAIGHLQRARGAKESRDFAGAERACAKAIEALGQLSPGRLENADASRLSAEAERLSGELRALQSDFNTAQIHLSAALQIGERLHRALPNDGALGRDLSMQYLSLGDLARDMRDYTAAEAAFVRALEIATRLVSASGEKPGRREALIAHQKLAIVYGLRKNTADAERHYSEAERLAATLAHERPDDGEAAFAHAMTHCALWEFYGSSGRHQESRAAGAKAARLLRHAVNLGASLPAGVTAMIPLLEGRG